MNMMGASSTVSNILYSYFNIKRSKLIWTGSLETLKAFVLTEIDEETAETTTWRSPSGGKWLFDSKLLSVTWLTKSQNIYFDGEKGSDLMERIHSFLKQDPDNASEIANPAELDLERSIESLLADDSDDVTDDTFEESFSDQCDIAKELKNQEEKQGSIDSETSTKHDESNTKSKNLHEESIGLYTVTKSGNLQTKSTNRHNPLGSSASCNRDSAEISRLNSKLDRFSENVTNKLQNLSVEINNIKENKPYSILVLENVVNDLKEDKLVLIRKNDELREQNMDMSHIISELKMANKNLESEKSSLLTALKLIQNDHQQTCTKTIVENDGENNVELVCETIEGSEVTQPKPSSNQPANDKHLNTEASTGKNRKKKGKKSKSKPPTQNSSQQTADVDTSGGIVNTSSFKSTGQGKKTVVIAGDSIVKNTIGPKMSADDPNHHFIVKPFPGATVSDMEDFVKPLTRRTPDKMILHVGTNDLRSHSTPKIIADSIVNIVTQIKEDSPALDLSLWRRYLVMKITAHI
ncbi:Tetratricopeptide repeat 28 [Paramuricea clavata]|uniref:Tetratricopeptide repeat 28 n=1 Tax=Paramuricea clavata TaxID=317549 RepID=A0A6S7KXY0_PARCT|nr:Tetratricopeptide repeat 28 [Paramuricea clavata]